MQSTFLCTYSLHCSCAPLLRSALNSRALHSTTIAVHTDVHNKVLLCTVLLCSAHLCTVLYTVLYNTVPSPPLLLCRPQVIGLINLQMAVQDDQLYIIEANPRASRSDDVLI